jgi:hypothetical protein
MKVLTVAMSCDEQDLISYFVRHYRQLGDVTIYDDISSDATAVIARDEGANVISMSQSEPEPDNRLLWVKNQSWKSMRDQYDWIIAVDIDEFLYHNDLRDALNQSQEAGGTVLVPCGYDMVADGPPYGSEPITTLIRRGVIRQDFCKFCCFNPKRVDDMNYVWGAHAAKPTGYVRLLPYPGLKLLHYHYLGTEWVLRRYASRRRRRGVLKVPEGLRDYGESAEIIQNFINWLDTKASEIT